MSIPSSSNLGRSGNPTWLAGNPTKSLARNPTTNCGKWEVQKKPRGDWVYNVGSCVTCFLESLRYNSIHNVANKTKPNTRLQTTSQPKVANFIQLRIFHTPGKIQLAAPVARKPRTATMAHKGAMEGPDFTGASPGVFGRW